MPIYDSQYIRRSFDGKISNWMLSTKYKHNTFTYFLTRYKWEVGSDYQLLPEDPSLETSKRTDIVLGDEQYYVFGVLLILLPTLATLVQDLNTHIAFFQYGHGNW